MNLQYLAKFWALLHLFPLYLSTEPTVHNLTAAKLIAIPKDIPIDVDQIILNGNYIIGINQDDFLGMSFADLQMEDNRLKAFPNFTVVKHSLKVLSLALNKIAYIDPWNLDILTNLQMLNLVRNHIDAIPDVPGPRETLQQLWLDHNRFVTFPSLRNLGKSITTLSLRGNAITTVTRSHAVFQDRRPSSPLQVNVNGNKLRTFPAILGARPSILGVNLSSNDIVCDIRMVWYLYLNNKDGVCSEPDRLKNTRLEKLTLEMIFENELNNNDTCQRMNRMEKDMFSFSTPMFDLETHDVMSCALECMSEKHCLYMNFYSAYRPSGKNCYISSPRGKLASEFEDDLGTNTTGWDYYEMVF